MKKHTGLILLLLAGGVGFGWVTWYLGSTAFEEEYVQIAPLALSIFFGVFALSSFAAILTLRYFTIHGETLIIKTALGGIVDEVSRPQITSWTKTPKKAQSNNRQELYLHLEARTVKLRSSYLGDRDAVLAWLGTPSSIQESIEPDNDKPDRVTFKISLVLGVLALIATLLGLRQILSTHEASETIQISSTLSLVEKVTGGRHGGVPSLHIGLADHPDFTFTVNSGVMSEQSIDIFIHDSKIGDRVYLKILAKDMRRKIRKEEELTFWDRSINYRFIDIIGLHYADLTYVEPIYYFQSRRENKITGVVFFGLCSSFMFFLSFRSFRRTKKTNPLAASCESEGLMF